MIIIVILQFSQNFFTSLRSLQFSRALLNWWIDFGFRNLGKTAYFYDNEDSIASQKFFEMDQMSHQRHDNFHFERGINNSRTNFCTVVTASGNGTNLDSHYVLDAYDNGIMYGVTPYNGIQHQHDNLDRGVPVATNVYYSGMNPSTSTVVSRNHIASGSSTFAVNGIHKWKHSEGMRGNYHRFNASTSSSGAPNARRTENGSGTLILQVPQLPHCGSWSRSGESMMVHDHNHLIQGYYSGQHFLPGDPLWHHQCLPMPYVQVRSANATSLENAIMGLQRYHDTTGSRSGHRFPHPPLVNPQYHIFHHQTQPFREIRGHSINFHPPVHAPSHRVPTNLPRNSSILIQNHEIGARHVGHVPFAHARIYRPHRGNMRETTLRHRNLPPLAFLHVQDDVALLSDHHSDMRLDIEDMSYEELLALGDRIGKVSTGLLEEMITSQLKTKTYIFPTNAINSEEADSEEHEPDSCIICQDEYKNQEKIGILRCGHEYHANCLKKWLLEKNVCPICKSEALTPGKKCV